MEIAWAKFEQVDTATAFGWLCGTAIRVQANDTRSNRRRQAHVERLVAEAETRPMTAYLESDSLLPQQREAILAAFQRLSEDDRELLRLAVWDGLDDEELAAAFDLNPAAARKRLSHARQRFRDVYAQVTAEPTAAGGLSAMAVFADPLDLLGAMNPVPDEHALPATSAYVPAQRTLQRILAQSLPRAPAASARDPRAGGGDDGGEGGGRRRRPSKRVLVGVAVATVGLLAAAAAWIVTRPADNPTRVACFAAADLEADTAPLAAGLGDPYAACEEVWRTGPFRAWGAVPPLHGVRTGQRWRGRLPRRAVGVRPAWPAPTCHGEWRLECSRHPVGGWSRRPS